jgi:predicted nucleic acid-binding Zn ribbon protein
LKKEHRRIISGGEMVTREVCSMYLQHYVRVISLVQKGRNYSKEDQRNSDRGSSPKESSSKGSSPKMRMALWH